MGLKGRGGLLLLVLLQGLRTELQLLHPSWRIQLVVARCRLFLWLAVRLSRLGTLTFALAEMCQTSLLLSL